MEEFDKMYYIAQILRKNCPSDKIRTSDKVISFLKEEIEEVEEALQSKKTEDIIEELGDLFWNVLFLIQIEQDKHNFKIERVLDKLNNKMTFRHPHVFKEPRNVTITEAEVIWKEQKQLEKINHINH